MRTPSAKSSVINGLKRRGFIATVAAGIAGLASQVGVRSVAAAPEPVVTESTVTPTTTTAIAATGGGASGALRVTNSSGTALYGAATGANGLYGVYGSSVNQYGGNFNSTNSIGLVSTSQSGQPGVYGSSASGAGVFGTSPSYGVWGQSTGSYGVHGSSVSSIGVVGSSQTTQPGVYGASNGGAGIFATSSGANGIALLAVSPSATGYAGQFDGRVLVTSDLNVSGNLTVQGQKSAVVPDRNGKMRRVYCVEATESYFEDFGEAEVVDGVVVIGIEDVFSSLVIMDRYFVTLTELERPTGLYVSSMTPHSFEVRSSLGAASGKFQWRVTARRKDIENHRMPETALPQPRRTKVDLRPAPDVPSAPPTRGARD